MKKVWIVIVTSFVLVASLALGTMCHRWFTRDVSKDVCRHVHVRAAFVPPEKDIPWHPTPESKPFPPSVRISDDQKQKLRDVVRDLEEAYTNCQIETMLNRLSQVPEYFHHLPRPIYLELNGFLHSETFVPRYLDKEKLPLSLIIEANDVNGFENYVHVCFEAARFVGNSLVRRGHGINNNDVETIESKLLNRLQAIKQHLHETGKRRLEERTDALISEWCMLIESSDGITRKRALQLVDHYLYMRKSKPEDCWLSNEKVLKIGRAQAEPLIRLGYTPKWLDVEFPLQTDVGQRTTDVK